MLLDENIPLLDLVLALSDTLDLASPKLTGHHLEVAYIAGELAKEYGLSGEQQIELVMAGALHDIGALSLAEKTALMEFEVPNPSMHSEMGYRLMKTFAPFSGLAELVRFHHVEWNDGEGLDRCGQLVPPGSHILHLADRISALRRRDEHVLNQVEDIRERITAESGTMFMPDLVDAFARLSEKQAFWLNAASPNIVATLLQNREPQAVSLGKPGLLALAEFFARIIDFRSKLTATHSAGVSAVGEALGELAGFSDLNCRMMRIAGYLHDLGKLVVPQELLEKPGKLTKDEYNIIYSHPFFTHKALQRIRGFDTIDAWASSHHERLNGRGYPSHPEKDLGPGARMLAVADVFTAIMEDRPYHKDIPVKTALQIIQQQADSLELDKDVTALLKRNLARINTVRLKAQRTAEKAYRCFHLNSASPSEGKGG